jgi:hypothetical protein
MNSIKNVTPFDYRMSEQSLTANVFSGCGITQALQSKLWALIYKVTVPWRLDKPINLTKILPLTVEGRSFK